MLRRFIIVVAAAAALASGSALPAPAADGSVIVGFSEDLPKELGADATAPMVALGAGAFRVTLTWNPGQTTVGADAATRIQRAVTGARGLRVVLAVYADAGSKAPRDAAARNAYCAYVADAVTRFPAIRDVVIWNEPNKSLFWSPQTNVDGSPSAPAAYTALLARCWDVLDAARPEVNIIGLALSSTGNDNAGSTSPGNFIRLVGEAYRASGRTRRLLDTVGHHPYGLTAGERPWRKHIAAKPIGMGDWNKLMFNLSQAFGGTAQPIPGQAGAAIWYLEIGFQTSVDAGKERAYTGAENAATLPDDAGGEPEAPPPAETTFAPDQATQVRDTIRLAACQPYVGAVFNFLLADEPRLEGWQSGVYWADLTPKDSADELRAATAEANAGAVACASLKGGPPSSDYTPPPAPAVVAAHAVRDPLRVVVTWDAVVDDASAVSYRVYRDGAHVATTSETTWTNVTVAGSQTYSYAVRAIDAAGNLGLSSAAATVTTPDVTPPTPPPGLTATATGDPPRVDVAWAASTDAIGVLGYEVFRDGAMLAATTATVFQDMTVAPGTTYAYAVVAFDAAGNRSSAATAQVTTPGGGTFADVSPTHPFVHEIEQLYQRGITTGCGRNDAGQLLFCPLANTTRQEIAAFLIRAKGLAPLTPATATFADVPPTHPFYGQIERMHEQRITTGCGRNDAGQLLFCPLANTTRQEIAAFLIRAKGLAPLTPATATFADVPPTHPFYGQIERMHEQRITTGCGRNDAGQLLFCPLANTTRQEIAAFVVRAFP